MGRAIHVGCIFEKRAKNWKNELGDYRLCEITPAIVVECRDRLSSGMTVRGTLRSPSTVVRYLALLSHMFTIAIKDYNWTEENPVLKISKPQEPRGRVRFLDEEETKRLLSACQQSRNSYLYVIVVLAISTGMRKGEIMNLKWTDINLAKEKIILQYTKNGES